MRIVSWNCNGKFRDKFKFLQHLDPDVCIIQECEDPSTSSKEEYRSFGEGAFWRGLIPYKGIGVFPRNGIKLEKLPWDDGSPNFIPAVVNGTPLLGVWTTEPYMEQFYSYMYSHLAEFRDIAVVMGDFNSNYRMDWNKKGERFHKKACDLLGEMGLHSAYHMNTEENPGEESQATFYLYRHKDKPFHIDYCFTKPDIIGSFQILADDPWLQYSDHLPMILDLKDA